jgi:hypothetical protein
MPDVTFCTIPIPGPAGAAGADGADGADGQNAYTTTTAAFTMPAEAADVTVTVVDSSWCSIDQIVYVKNGGAKGYFLVAAIPSATQLTLTNIEDTAATRYPDNSAVGTNFASGSKITAAGIQGPNGAAGGGAPTDATYICQTAHASLSAEQALSSLTTGVVKVTTGTGALSTAVDGTDYLSPSTGLEPADIGVTVQAYDAFLTSIAALGTVADRILYTTALNVAAEATLTAFARTLLDDATAAAARTTLDVLPGYGLLASSDALNLNSATTDTAVTVNATRYLIDKITLESPSAAVTTATLGLFTAAGGGGTTLCANQALSGTLTAATKIMHLAKQSIVDTDSRTDGTLYLRVGTAEGSARTVNVKIYGWRYAA